MPGPRVVQLAESTPEDVIADFVEIAAAGGLLIFPTDTVYGLGVNADREEAVSRLFDLKQRPAELAIPVLIGSRADLARVVGSWPPAAEALARAFWPGPLTLVLPKHPDLSLLVTAQGETVGVRLPHYAALQSWLSACDFPLAVTSANRSGEPPPKGVDQIPLALRAAAELILDGGACPGGVPSTVVDVTCSPPRILREGPLSAPEIRAALTAAGLA